MASFRYILQNPYEQGKRDKKGNKVPAKKETTIYLWVIHDGSHTMKLKTEYRVSPKNWDFSEKCVKPQASNSVKINGNLNTFREKVKEEFLKLRKDFPNMKWEELRDNLKVFIIDDISPVYSERNKPFFEVYDEFINDKSNDVSELTVKKYHTSKNSLQEFNPLIRFDQIDQKFYNSYVRHLRTKQPKGRMKTRDEDKQNGLLNDTIGKMIEVLKLFLKWSFENEYHENDNYAKSWFKVNQKSKKQQQEGKQDIVTLFIDELMHFYNFDFSDKPRLERVRDKFCFMAFTLQRWSDALQFSKEQVKTVQFEGQLVDAWEFTSYKTGKKITVPFVGDYLGKAYEIAEKYNFELPAISEQKFNQYLKEAGKLAGLTREKEFKRYVGQKEIVANKPIQSYMSSHMGRRTGISILLNVYNMPLHFVRDLSGHSDLKTLDLYLDKDTTSLIGSLMKNTNGVGYSPLKIAK